MINRSLHKMIERAPTAGFIRQAFPTGTGSILIGGVGLVASVAAWLLCRLSGYTVAAWVAPLAICTFCLGLFVGAENTTRGMPSGG